MGVPAKVPAATVVPGARAPEAGALAAGAGEPRTAANVEDGVAGDLPIHVSATSDVHIALYMSKDLGTQTRVSKWTVVVAAGCLILALAIP